LGYARASELERSSGVAAARERVLETGVWRENARAEAGFTGAKRAAETTVHVGQTEIQLGAT